MSFYVTLPSDSSMNYFPENKISHYITHLPTPIELLGSWEVALTQIIYPHTWYNVNEHNNLFGYDIGNGKMVGRRIPPGYYNSTSEIVNAMKVEDQKPNIFFDFNDNTKKVRISVREKARVCLEDGLAQLLGFEPLEVVSFDSNLETTMESPFSADPCVHYQILMVYTDIIEPQIVGNVLAPLLRIVNVTGRDGEMVSAQYDRPHYLPVSRIINSLEIVIRTHTGALTPFERGRSYVKLHFRQKHLV